MKLYECCIDEIAAASSCDEGCKSRGIAVSTEQIRADRISQSWLNLPNGDL
jgi:hypothetical protein